MAAGARPEVFLAGRPTTEWASDAGGIGVEALILLSLAIQHNRLVMPEGAHAPLL